MHPDLVLLSDHVLMLSEYDLVILDGLRTQEQQEALYKAGATRTRESKHLTGDALDFGVLVDGKLRWDWPLYDKLAETVYRASKHTGVHVVWGGAWHRKLTDFDCAAGAKEDYLKACRDVERKPFLDGPHYHRWLAEKPGTHV